MVTTEEAKIIINNHKIKYEEKAALYQPFMKEPCKHLTEDFICVITNDDKKEKEGYRLEQSLSYCYFLHNFCNLANGNIVLKENEYTNAELVIAGKVFVNNKGIRFNCISPNIIECPYCKSDLRIISFCFGIFCHNCNKQIH